MTDFLEHVLSHLVKQVKELKALVLRGSRQSDLDAETDSWSDTDLLIVLNPAAELQKERLFQVIDELGFVIGKEIQGVSEQSVLYRAAIEYEGAVHLLDAHFCSYEEWVSTEAYRDQASTLLYGSLEWAEERRPAAPMPNPFEAYASDETWFKYFIAIKKFVRQDHLIGLHLLLDLVREYLVVEMLERDKQHGTNIHRFGYGELLPSSLQLSSVDVSRKEELYAYMGRLACAYDAKLLANQEGYRSKAALVIAYLEQAKASLERG
ncbi:hypothetical protein [Gorillibacterium sp. CAU 1737]|uniref:hypothetical protein n=1 Tax=Gorillibacterium sp. CAU 1737 TaxID=3140362 RepID=UPI003260F97F